MDSLLSLLFGQPQLISPEPKKMSLDQAVAQMQQQGWKEVPQYSLPQTGKGLLPVPSPTITPSQGQYGRNPALSKYSIQPEVHSAIQSAAKEFNVLQALMYDIAASEGGFNAGAKNTTPEGQIAGVPEGLYQFTPYTWNTVGQYATKPDSSLSNWNNPARSDPLANARAAAYLISRGQLGRWAASASNWGKFYTDEELKPYFTQTPGWKGLPK